MPEVTPDAIKHGVDIEVDYDLKCLKCGYNLRGQRGGDNCPECGTPVKQSIQGDLLVNSKPGWLRGMATGSSLMGIALGGPVLISIGMTLAVGKALSSARGAARQRSMSQMAEAFDRFEAVLYMFTIASYVLTLLTIVAFVKLTAAEPGPAGKRFTGLRLVTLLCGLIYSIGMALLPTLGFFYEQITEYIHIGWDEFKWILIASGVGFCFYLPANYLMLTYLARVIRREPNEALAGQTERIRTALALAFLAVIGFSVFFVLSGSCFFIIFIMGFSIAWTVAVVKATFCMLGYTLAFRGAAGDAKAAEQLSRAVPEVVKLEPDDFKEKLADAFRDADYEVQMMEPPDDDVFDMVIEHDEVHRIVLARHYRDDTINDEKLKQFYDAAEEFGGWTEAIVVTGGHFTDAARRYALGRKLRLLEGEELKELLEL